jgi:hypothetical protein
MKAALKQLKGLTIHDLLYWVSIVIVKLGG